MENATYEVCQHNAQVGASAMRGLHFNSAQLQKAAFRYGPSREFGNITTSYTVSYIQYVQADIFYIKKCAVIMSNNG